MGLRDADGRHGAGDEQVHLMRWPATAALALSAVVAGYLNAIAVGTLFWSSRLPKAGESIGGLFVTHPVAASLEVLVLLAGAGLLVTLACGALAYRLRHRLGTMLAFAMPLILMAVMFSLTAWSNISSPHF
jgi:hypothetical protein